MKDRVGIAVLGATGSVGRQTLEVAAAFPDRFDVVALSGNKNAPGMADLMAAHKPSVVCMADPDGAEHLRRLLDGKLTTRVEAGPDCLPALARMPQVDVVVASIVGHSGLESLVAAVQAGKKVALANKESLVMAGQWLMPEVNRCGATILPVDSEHAAVHQMATAVGLDKVRRVVLTASGGPFLGKSRGELERVTARQALAHPNWRMGTKVSIDSATMMNKGFEVIEARWLFDLPPERIEVVIHPQSRVHAVVEMTDGSMLAHMAPADMRVSIAHALGHPGQLDLPARIPGFVPLELATMGSLTFQAPDPEAFVALGLCRQALALGGGLPAALSAADEVVVEAFLQDRIRFTDITDVLQKVLETVPPGPAESLEDLLAAADHGTRIAIEEVDARATS